ncbi:hypothetical protein [Mycolicibacterium baixiangningiae]|uniref:hypothetical protein n=1 Tax=Mycolicibacterium baixiangningiae TaxID=2761578 RepID=UPI0018D0B8F2|nr:hypothetical protein [Mycolicibacterium baixiangningiae]
MATDHDQPPRNRKLEAATERVAEALAAVLADYPSDDHDDVEALSRHISQSPARSELEAALRAATPLGYHNQPDVIQLHRVIGGYIDRFSSLIAYMRQAILMYFAAPEDIYPVHMKPLLDILFATMTAKPITDAFFAMSTRVGNLDEAELAVRNALRRRVEEHVTFRNDIVHADWSIGWTVADTDEPVPSAAYKIKNKSGVPTMGSLDISTNDIVDQINELQSLYDLVMAFGNTCRKRQLGQGRVSDVLEVVPASPTGGTAVRKKSNNVESRD